jgi:PiT family inorganic phosphate transporter
MAAVPIAPEMIAVLVLLALAFGFMNGFHDAANAIAAVVSTGALKPQYAVAWAAVFNFVAILIFPLAVAATVGRGIIEPLVVDHLVIMGALAGALVWSLITWYHGIPSSSSHNLIGGLIGAAVAKAGGGALITSGVMKIVLFIFVSPVLGFLLGALLMVAAARLLRRAAPRRADRWLRRLQLASAALYSLGHGGNDAQKTIGILWMLLIAAGLSGTQESVPPWVVVACYAAIALGTLFGGWRIVKTMGQKITKLKPVGGFCVESSGALTLFIANGLGLPVSTTHTIAGAIVGVGAARQFNAVRWGVAGGLVWAWVLTIPASAFIAAVAWYLAKILLG